MKAKIFIAALALLGFTATAVAEAPAMTESTMQQSKKSVKVTIVKDNGVITTSGDTERFQLRLSETFSYPIAVEVKVMVDGKCLGHKPVIIDPRMLNSYSEYIKVGTAHKGKKYTLQAKIKEGRPDTDDNM